MTSCFAELLDFIRIMPDGLDQIVALKKSILFLILSKLLKIMYFFLISSNYINTGITFNLLMRQKIFYGKDNEAEVITSERHMSDGQMHSFLQLFRNTEKISLN